MKNLIFNWYNVIRNLNALPALPTDVEAEDIAVGDDMLTALAKLQARIEELENA